MVISNRIKINREVIARDNVSLPELLQENNSLSPEKFYDHLQCNYPKFFKMDKLCKWAMAGAAYLFSDNDLLYTGIDKNMIAVILTTSHGCLDVDKRYYDGNSVPSPALFVYTLPNIMLGEICIRYGFKGEQLCMVSEKFDAEELYFTTHDVITNRGMEACLCGWVDATSDQYNVCLFWVTKNGNGPGFTPALLKELYHLGEK